MFLFWSSQREIKNPVQLRKWIWLDWMWHLTWKKFSLVVSHDSLYTFLKYLQENSIILFAYFASTVLTIMFCTKDEKKEKSLSLWISRELRLEWALIAKYFESWISVFLMVNTDQITTMRCQIQTQNFCLLKKLIDAPRVLRGGTKQENLTKFVNKII